jgi:hypothetical protein
MPIRPDIFLWIFRFGIFTEICEHIMTFVKIRHITKSLRADLATSIQVAFITETLLSMWSAKWGLRSNWQHKRFALYEASMNWIYKTRCLADLKGREDRLCFDVYKVSTGNRQNQRGRRINHDLNVKVKRAERVGSAFRLHLRCSKN